MMASMLNMDQFLGSSPLYEFSLVTGAVRTIAKNTYSKE
jgi:hypothetical protein